MRLERSSGGWHDEDDDKVKGDIPPIPPQNYQKRTLDSNIASQKNSKKEYNTSACYKIVG